jgi:hypothetical protein
VAEAKPIDWQSASTLWWTKWFIDDVVGVDGVNELALWAANGSRLVLEGPDDPISNVSLPPLDSGLALNVALWLSKLEISGWGNVARFESPHAVSPTDLAFGLDLGTDQSPTVNVSVDVGARITARDTKGASSPSSVDEGFQIKLGLTRPSVNGEVRVVCDASRWVETKTVAQLFFGGADCLKSTLLEAPLFKGLAFHFQGLSQPLAIDMKTTGDLEAGIAKFLNNGALLFDEVYSAHLPDALERFLSSKAGLHEVNAAVSDHFQPSECISDEAAQKKVEDLPYIFYDWPLLIKDWARALVDNMVDGFFQKNNTRITEEAFSMMPSLHQDAFTSDEVDLEKYLICSWST